MIRILRSKSLILVAALSLTALASPALCCSRSYESVEYSREYYASVTSVYRAVSEGFTPEDSRYPDNSFTIRLRPLEAIWGEAPAGPVTLEFTPGACVDWYLETDAQDVPLNGKEYFVFVAPQSMAASGIYPENAQLRALPAGGQQSWEAMVLLRELQITGDGPPPPPENFPFLYPEGSPLKEPTFWTRSYPWPWAAGAAGALFIIGLILGRAIRPRDKQRKNP